MEERQEVRLFPLFTMPPPGPANNGHRPTESSDGRESLYVRPKTVEKRQLKLLLNAIALYYTLHIII